MNQTPEPEFRKSTFSTNGDCVEVATNPSTDEVFVRDSKSPDGPQHQFTKSEWRAFIAGVRDGQFDV